MDGTEGLLEWVSCWYAYDFWGECVPGPNDSWIE